MSQVKPWKGKMHINIKHPGQLHRDTGTPQGEKIPEAKIRKQLHSSSAAKRKRAQFAENARHWND